MVNLAVIEGFYGRCWTWPQRKSMIDFMAKSGFCEYIYAPKSDPFLRSQWQSCWPTADFIALQSLAEHSRSAGVDFSVGFTPLEVQKSWPNNEIKHRLRYRLEQIKELELSSLAILFDDMWGSIPGLAQLQVDITHFIADHLGLDSITICPSYYSFDPLLEDLFGPMPQNYWHDLGKLLDPAAGFFWTGDHVISDAYPLVSSEGGLQTIAEMMQRLPTIWDNSRVNDGRKTSPFLPVSAMTPIDELSGNIDKFVVNPMNPPALAKIVLQTLVESGANEARLAQSMALPCFGFVEGFKSLLPLLTDVGLNALTTQQHDQIQSLILSQDKANPVIKDLSDWVEGAFQFDPSCLT